MQRHVQTALVCAEGTHSGVEGSLPEGEKHSARVNVLDFISNSLCTHKLALANLSKRTAVQNPVRSAILV